MNSKIIVVVNNTILLWLKQILGCLQVTHPLLLPVSHRNFGVKYPMPFNWLPDIKNTWWKFNIGVLGLSGRWCMRNNPHFLRNVCVKFSIFFPNRPIFALKYFRQGVRVKVEGVAKKLDVQPLIFSCLKKFFWIDLLGQKSWFGLKASLFDF